MMAILTVLEKGWAFAGALPLPFDSTPGGVRVSESVASEFGATMPFIGLTAIRPPPLPRPLAEDSDAASTANVTG